MESVDRGFSLLGKSQVNKIIACFFAADVFLVAFYLALHMWGAPYGIQESTLFALDGEGNVPAWYSSMQLLFVGAVAFVYGRLVLIDDKVAGTLILLFAVAFAYLAMDEGATLHERIGDRLDMLFTGGGTTADTAFETTGMWMVYLGPPLFIVLIAGTIFIRKRLAIPFNVFAKAIAGIVIFVSGATLGDIVLNYVSAQNKPFQVAAEEFCEMVGVTLILWAVMTLLADKEPRVYAAAHERERVLAPRGQPVRGRASPLAAE